jgi:hypothetical protein
MEKGFPFFISLFSQKIQMIDILPRQSHNNLNRQPRRNMTETILTKRTGLGDAIASEIPYRSEHYRSKKASASNL